MNGGGRVVVPAGLYKTGTIVLKDGVELHLSSGADLVSSRNPADFKVFPPTSYRSLKDAGGWVSMIYAEGARNIAITGLGTIDGRGSGYKGTIHGVAGDCNGRPRNILFISCKNVHVEGITMRNSALWNQHYLNCEDVTVNNIRVWNHCNGNNDGVDIDGCRRFVLSNSIIDSDDDGIVLKSTGMAPCEDVNITGVPDGYIENVTLRHIDIQTRGGLKKGSYRTPGDDANIRHDTSGNLFASQYWKSAKQVKEDVNGYPQPTVWGNLPCYGLFVRHVKNITMQDVHFSSKGTEPRPAIIQE